MQTLEKIKSLVQNKLFLAGNKEKKLSKKAQRAKEVILKSDFGCQKESVRKLVSALLEEEIILEESEVIETSFLESILNKHEFILLQDGDEDFWILTKAKESYCSLTLWASEGNQISFNLNLDLNQNFFYEVDSFEMFFDCISKFDESYLETIYRFINSKTVSIE